jgi:hypothetical protein
MAPDRCTRGLTFETVAHLFACCGLAGQSFCASCMAVGVASHLDLRDGFSGESEFFRSLLGSAYSPSSVQRKTTSGLACMMLFVRHRQR